MLFLATTLSIAATLTVDVDTEALSGTVQVRLYSSSEGYPGSVSPDTRVGTFELATERSTTFHDLHPGTYAVVVLHDVDGDGAIATNWMGIPTEPVGVYLPPGTRLWGPPSFRRTSFNIDEGEQQIGVSLVTP